MPDESCTFWWYFHGDRKWCPKPVEPGTMTCAHHSPAAAAARKAQREQLYGDQVAKNTARSKRERDIAATAEKLLVFFEQQLSGVSYFSGDAADLQNMSQLVSLIKGDNHG